MSGALCILLVEDHPIVRAGCQRLLRERGQITVVEAHSATDGVNLCREVGPDLVILDLGLPDAKGLTTLQRMLLMMPDLKVLIFSMREEPMMVAGALELGARGYVSKNDDPGVLLEAVERIAAGDVYLSRHVAQKMALMNLSAGGPLRGLSAREHEVLKLLGTGRSLAEIATELGVSYRTSAAVTAQIRAKLNLSSMPELIRFAVEHAQTATQ